MSATAQISKWCEQSKGISIEIAPGIERSFISLETYSSSDVVTIEQALTCTLPQSYYDLLASVGQSCLFMTNYGLGIFLFSPNEVIVHSQRIWEEEAETGEDVFCFIGANRNTGDYIGFVISRPAPRNFDVFCHEYPPAEYAETSDELKSWRTLDEWLIRLVESFGQESL